MPGKTMLKMSLKPLLAGVLVTALALLLLNIPLPRQIGLSARYDLLIPLGLLVIFNSLVLSLPGMLGQLLGPVYFTVLFALPLSGLWASGTSEQYLMSGTIPNSVVILYYIDSHLFIEGRTVSAFSADKPFISALLSGLLAITHYNLATTLVLILLLVILAVYLAVRELQRTHGTTAASVFLIIIFFYIRRYTGTTMSENLGLCFGLLAFILLWRHANPAPAASPPQDGWLVAGMGVLCLALFSRLGAFLTLPILLLGVIWVTKQKRRWSSWKTPALIVLVLVLMMVFNRFIIYLIAGPDANTSTQFSIQLYSLVTGGRYFGALESDHPELMQLAGNAYLIKTIQICFSVFMQQPLSLLQGILHNYGTYFGDVQRGEYSYIDGASDAVNQAFRLGFFLLAGTGLGTLFLRRSRPIRWLVGLFFIGIMLSIPFVPPEFTYKLRLMAATIWIQALLPALAVAWLVSVLSERSITWRLRLPAPPQISAWPSAMFAMLLLAFLVITTLVIHLFAHATPLPQAACPAREQAAFLRTAPGTYAELVSQNDPRQGWQPYIRLAYFKIKIHNLAEMTQYPFFEAIQQPTALLEGMELVTHQEILIFAPAESYSQKPGVVLACGNFLKDPPPYTEDFFFAQSLQELNIP